jgi:hypothetical protein
MKKAEFNIPNVGQALGAVPYYQRTRNSGQAIR